MQIFALSFRAFWTFPASAFDISPTVDEDKLQNSNKNNEFKKKIMHAQKFEYNASVGNWLEYLLNTSYV